MAKLFGQMYGVVREMVLAVDAGNSVRHGVSLSENVRRHTAPHHRR